MRRGDIYMVRMDPAEGREQQGHRPVVVISPSQFNDVTKLPVVLPVTTGGQFARRIGLSVELSGGKTTGIVRCDQPRVLDIAVRGGRWIETLGDEIVAEVLAKVAVIFRA